MLIRDYFSKDIDLDKISKKEKKRVQHELIEPKRKTLNWKFPNAVF
jgi:IS30 family transposase